MLDKKNFYINGQWIAPKKPNDYKVIDPSTEEECAVISLGVVEDVNDAVGAAKKAFETWAFSSKEERLEYLEALYTIYKKRWADMAQAISLEMGAPIDFSTQLQAGTGASHIKSYIKVLKEYTFEKILGDHAPNNKILHEPKGVVCGPGSIEQAHKIDEFIVLDELKKCLNLLDGIKKNSITN